VWEGTCVVCSWNPNHYNEAVLLITSWLLEWRTFNGHRWVEFTGRINYKLRLRNVKEIEGNNCGLVFRRYQRYVRRDWGRQRKAFLEIIGLQWYLWTFRIRNTNSHVDARCISTALRLLGFLRNSLSSPSTKHEKVTWSHLASGQSKVSVLSPKILPARHVFTPITQTPRKK